MTRKPSRREDALLGMKAPITRRDFLNTTLLGAGAALLGAAAPAASAPPRGAPRPGGPGGLRRTGSGLGGQQDLFTGYGGVGDYARANGNTWPVVQAAHRMRDGGYDALPVQDSGETYDLVVVGGGIAGLTAAWRFAEETGGSGRCLILENHAMFGGNARRNEFLVEGERLVAPQASNDFSIPRAGTGSMMDRFFAELGIPREYRYQTWDADLEPLRFALDNYANMDGLMEQQVDVAYVFGGADGSPPEVQRNIWDDDLQRTPFSPEARRDLLRWRYDFGRIEREQDRFLDTITYRQYLEDVQGYDPAVTRFVDPFIALLGGVGADGIAARVGRRLVFPPDRGLIPSYPGGNTVFARHLVRALIPDAMPGADTFQEIHNGAVDEAALDRSGAPTRLRLEATVVEVEHERGDPAADTVRITYARDGALHRVRARSVVMATPGGVNVRVLRDLPAPMREAYGQFLYGPALIVNVALRQWRPLYDMGATALRWFDGDLGFVANIRRSMVVGDYDPPLHPDRPNVLTFYMGLPEPGLPAAEQAAAGRRELLETTYAEYERRVRRQLATMLGGTGFDPARDIAGIILNRWGHARVVQTPGFYYGTDGRPSPREVVEEGYGRIAVAHSELNGSQNATGAIQRGTAAAERVVEMLG